jgi:hypothetical protein
MNNQESSLPHIRPVQGQCRAGSSLSEDHGRITNTNFGRESTRPVQSTITLNAALAMSRSFYSIAPHDAMVENWPVAATDRAQTRAAQARQPALAEILNEALAITSDTGSLVRRARPSRAPAE